MARYRSSNGTQRLGCLALVIGCLLQVLHAQEVHSDPVGLVRLTCLGNSDTLCGLPLTRPAEFSGKIQGVSKNVLTVSGNPAWSTNRFSGTQAYYVSIGTHLSSNPNEGRFYRILGNTISTLTLELNGDSIESVAAGTPLTIYPYWTLATLFPASDANVSFTPSPNVLSIKTQILIPDYTSTGINLAASKAYFYINSGSNVGWRKSGDSMTADRGSDLLLPDGYLIVRNKNNAPTLPLRICGSVMTGKQSTALDTNTLSKQDNSLSLIRPVELPLKSVGLSPEQGNFVTSTGTNNIQDQLLVFDNSVAAINRSPGKAYFYLSNSTNIGWRLVGAPITEDHGNDIIGAASALIVRKAVADGITRFFTNSPNY